MFKENVKSQKKPRIQHTGNMAHYKITKPANIAIQEGENKNKFKYTENILNKTIEENLSNLMFKTKNGCWEEAKKDTHSNRTVE